MKSSKSSVSVGSSEEPPLESIRSVISSLGLAPHQSVTGIIKALNLKAHIEGGFYTRSFTSDVTSLMPQGPRPAITSIYYLCRAGEKCSLHELLSDELWFWHAGDALEIVEISNTYEDDTIASVKRTRISGGVVGSPQLRFSHAVRAGTVFGATCRVGGQCGFSLVSCAVAPGFDFADWKMEKASVYSARFLGADAAAAIAELATGI